MNRLANEARVMAAAGAIAIRAAGDSPGTSASKLSVGCGTAARLKKIEELRAAHGVTVKALANEAKLDPSWYRAILRQPERASEAVIGRLADALRYLRERRSLDDARSIAYVQTMYGGFLAALAPHFGVTPAQVRAADPRRGRNIGASGFEISRARAAAVYLTNQSVGVEQRLLARALGMTAPAVCQLIRSVEDRRDVPAFDRLLDDINHQITGRWM